MNRPALLACGSFTPASVRTCSWNTSRRAKATAPPIVALIGWTAMRRGDADLCDVARLRGYQAAQREPAQLACLAVQRHIRGGLEKGSASGILHDVVQETARAADRIVLIVDAAVDMAAVGLRNQVGGGFLMPVLPRRKVNAGAGRTGPQQFRLLQTESHEVAVKGLEKPGPGNGFVARAQHHELGFDSPDRRRAH